MNSSFSKNLLLTDIETTAEPVEELFKLCFKHAQKSKTILYLSFKQIDKLPDIGVGYADKEVLKRIVFMYFNNINRMIDKLLDLQTWAIVPHLIILDCFQLQEILNDNEWPKQKICLMIASLFSLTQTCSKRIDENCTSIIYMDRYQIPNDILQLLVDLYYYRHAYSGLKDILPVLEG